MAASTIGTRLQYATPPPPNIDRWDLFDFIPGPDEYVSRGTYASTADLLAAKEPVTALATCVQHKDPAPTRHDKMVALGTGLGLGALVGTALAGAACFGLPAVLNVLGVVANTVFWPAAHAGTVPFGPAWALLGGAAAGAAIGGYAQYHDAAQTQITTDGKLFEQTENNDTTLYFDGTAGLWNLGPRGTAPNYQI